jgi:hypothetical protein
MRAEEMENLTESAILLCNNKGRLLDHTAFGMESLMAGLALNLTNSVATVGRTLLRMLDALAETGMRHAHREINRGQNESKPVPPKRGKRKSRADSAMH